MPIQPVCGYLRLQLILKYALCALAATVGLSGCSKSFQSATAQAPEENIALICFRYIGSSDHPVWPLIIIDNASSEEKAIAQLQPLDHFEIPRVVKLTKSKFEKCL